MQLLHSLRHIPFISVNIWHTVLILQKQCRSVWNKIDLCSLYKLIELKKLTILPVIPCLVQYTKATKAKAYNFEKQLRYKLSALCLTQVSTCRGWLCRLREYCLIRKIFEDLSVWKRAGMSNTKLSLVSLLFLRVVASLLLRSMRGCERKSMWDFFAVIPIIYHFTKYFNTHGDWLKKMHHSYHLNKLEKHD